MAVIPAAKTVDSVLKKNDKLFLFPICGLVLRGP